MISQPRFAVSVGDVDALDHSGLVAHFRDIETAGFGSIWIPEVLGREAFTTAQLALSVTDRLIVGSGVARALERVPKSAAAAQAGLVEGWPGRYVLGLGVSGAVRAERGIGPLPFLRSYLDGIDAHLAGRGLEPGPRVLGAYSAGLTGLAARRADGLLTNLVTPEHTAWARGVLGPGGFLSVSQWVVLDTDRVAARAAARSTLAYYLGLPHQLAKLRGLGFTDDDLAPPGSDHLIDTLVLHGSAEEIAAGLHVHLDAGADQVQIGVLGEPGAAKGRGLAALAAAVGAGRGGRPPRSGAAPRPRTPAPRPSS